MNSKEFSIRSEWEVEFPKAVGLDKAYLELYKKLLVGIANIDKIEYLFQKCPALCGADLRDDDGRNAFLLACLKGRVDVLQLIRSMSKNLDYFKLFDSDGNTGIHLAAYNSHIYTIRWLAVLDNRFLSSTNRNLFGSDPIRAADKCGNISAAAEIKHLRERFVDRLHSGEKGNLSPSVVAKL